MRLLRPSGFLGFLQKKRFAATAGLLLGILLIVVSGNVRADDDTTPPQFDFLQWREGYEIYGENLENNDEPKYQFEFYVNDDESSIATIEYEVDGNGRIDLSSSVTTGDIDETSEHVDFLFDQRDYADDIEHQIVFYATDSVGNENSYSFYFTNPSDTTNPTLTYEVDPPTRVANTSLPYVFWARDDAYVSSVEAYIDDPSNPVELTRDDGASNRTEWKYDQQIDITGFDDGSTHTLYVIVTDFYGNQVTDEDEFFYNTESEEDPPVLNFTEVDEGLSPAVLHYAGTATDESGVYEIRVEVDGEHWGHFHLGGEISPESKAFDNDIDGLSAGEHVIRIIASDIFGNSTSQDFEVDIDGVIPSCVFSNLPSPHYSKIVTYSNISCTDNRGITDAQIRAYHSVNGDLIAWGNHGVTPVDGTFGSTTETFDITFDLSSMGNQDGNISFEFHFFDEAGNSSFDYDPLVIEADDATAPTINLDEVSPDPLTDTTPTITGTCRDNDEFELNSFIQLLEYKVDDGEYQDIGLDEGQNYNDSYSESFSVDLSELSLDNHTVSIRCTDAAGNVSETEDQFEVVAPDSPIPGEFTFTESFEDYSKQDIPNSENTIWGNGQLRLKEDITITRTLIENEGVCSRYADCRGDYAVRPDPQDSELLWYARQDRLYYHNRQTNTSAEFDFSGQYDIDLAGEVSFKLGIFNEYKYLWVNDSYRLVVINLTTNQLVLNNSDLFDIENLTLDFERGRLAAYFTIPESDGFSNLAYLDLQGTETTDDDVLTRYPEDNFLGAGISSLLIDSTSNAVYAGAYNWGVYKFNDNNTPGDPNDDTLTSYQHIDYTNVFAGALALDPQNRLIFGTANNSNGKLFVISDDGGTPWDASDDTVTQLATPLKLRYKNIFHIQYIQGENGIGDQLLLSTEDNNPVYLNFNNTYTNPYDDTFIELDVNAGVRPAASTVYAADYDTIYANNRRQGFYKVELDRGWKSGGIAVALPNRPSEQLVINNFLVDANLSTTIADASGVGGAGTVWQQLASTLVPQVHALGENGVHYYVSTDGGMTYTEVSLNQLQQLQQNDYRLKFKIEMEPIDGATPVLDSYSLTYGGYPTEEAVTTVADVSIVTNTTSTTTDGAFTLTTEVVDAVGFKVAGTSGTVTLTLIDAATDSVTDGLSVSSAELADGTVTITGVSISKVGTYRIRATYGSFSTDSATITITSDETLPTPTLSFFADRYTIKKGEGALLQWTSNNLNSFTINPGNKVVTSADGSGSLMVYPTATTEYSIVGSGDYGQLNAHLTIKVEGEVTSNEEATSSTSSSPTPSPTPTARPFFSLLTPDDPGETSGIFQAISPDQTIVQGQKATITWHVPEADVVYVEYPGYPRTQMSTTGGFEFFPNETTQVLITAIKDGQEYTQVITVTVVSAPLPVQQVVRSVEMASPLAGKILGSLLAFSPELPKLGAGILAVAEVGMVALTTVLVVSQSSLTALNARTVADILRVSGILPFKKRKGFVHQTHTGEPIPFATISIYDQHNQNRLFATLVSDMYGVYYEPFLDRGQYAFSVAQSSYNFPTTATRPVHLSEKDFYKGETINVTSNRDRQSILIPMDAVQPAQVKSRITAKLLLILSHLMVWLQWLVYPLFVLSIWAFTLQPGVFNGLVLVLYGVMILFRVIHWFKRPTAVGRVVIERTQRPVANVSVSLSLDNGQLVGISKSDTKGNFAFYVPKGTYTVQVVSDNYVWTESSIGSTPTLTINGNNQPLVLKVVPVRS